MSNDITTLLPKLVARGLMALRQEARMPRLVNRAYEDQPGKQFSTVTIPVPAAVTVQDVTPANTPPSTADTALTEVQLVVDQWKEAPFYLTDKEMTQIDAQENFLPMQASEAVKAIANTLDRAIWAQYVNFAGFAGTPGVTPFATDTSDYTDARRELNEQLAPMDPRYMVINTDAEANALNLRAFQDASFSGSIDGIVNGQINNKLGARWMMSQNAPSHTQGVTSGTVAIDNGPGYTAGATTIHVDGMVGQSIPGDHFTIAGDETHYVVVTSSTLVGTDTDLAIYPPLAVTVANDVVLTFAGDYAVNLLFHPMAIALVTRPFDGADPFALGKFFSLTDPISGIALRLEVTREHKRTRFAYDVLYGIKTVRKELGVVLAG